MRASAKRSREQRESSKCVKIWVVKERDFHRHHYESTSVLGCFPKLQEAYNYMVMKASATNAFSRIRGDDRGKSDQNPMLYRAPAEPGALPRLIMEHREGCKTLYVEEQRLLRCASESDAYDLVREDSVDGAMLSIIDQWGVGKERFLKLCKDEKEANRAFRELNSKIHSG